MMEKLHRILDHIPSDLMATNQILAILFGALLGTYVILKYKPWRK